MLVKVKRICELSRRQHVAGHDSAPLISKQELVDDQRTLSETWESINSPQEARQSLLLLQPAHAVEHYNRHAAFGRKMSLRERYICGVLAARFWDGTNPTRAKQEREQIDAKTASNFEKWCGAGHLHTSMKVCGLFLLYTSSLIGLFQVMLSEIRFALVCDMFPGILLLPASEFPWTLFAEHSAQWLDAFRQAASLPAPAPFSFDPTLAVCWRQPNSPTGTVHKVKSCNL